MSSGTDTSKPEASREQAILARAHAQWMALRASDPEYFAYMEDANPMLARRAELLDLMDRAPSESVFMYLFANFSMRLEIAAITGREFS